MKQTLRLGRTAASFVRSIEHTKLSQSPALRAISARTFHSTGCRFEEKRKEEPTGSASFRGQLYESTSDRLKRERESEARYIQAQRQRKAEPRTLALSVGVYVTGIVCTSADIW